MRITAICDIVAPISSEIANAYIDFSRMTASVVALHSDLQRDGKPIIGFGFNSNGRYAVQGLLRERFIPRLAEADPRALLDDAGLIDPARAWPLLMANEKPGGHGERSVAVGVIDMALWDLRAKAEGKPLWRLLAERYRPKEFGAEADPHAWVYAAGGYYYPGKGIAALQDEIRHYRDLGYACVKIKIGGVPLAEDLTRIEAVLKVVGDGANLAVDANGRFDLDTAIAYADALQPYGLRWYEEPLDPLDYRAHAILGERYAPPLATGDSVHDARNLIRHAGLRPDRDVLQFDPALSYGLVEYLRTLDMLRAHGWSWRRCVPHGGHQFALNIAVGLGLGGNESYPDVFAPFGGFADDCPVENSLVRLPDIPGIGFEAKAALYRVMQPLAEG